MEFLTLNGQETIQFINDNDPKLWRETGRIKYLDASEASREIHVLALNRGKIVGIAGMQVNPYDEEQLWIKFISVDPKCQGRGYGSALLGKVFEYANEHRHKVAPGSFTEEGERLRHLHDRFEAEFPEVAYHRDSKGNYVRDDGRIVRSGD